MAIKFEPGNLKKIKADILQNIDRKSYEIESEADFFLDMLAENIDNKLALFKAKADKNKISGNIKIFRNSPSRDSLQQLNLPSPLSNKGFGFIDPSEGLNIIHDADFSAKKIFNPGNIDESIKTFTNELMKNAENGVISAKSIYKTMKKICPLFPFC